MTWTIVNGSEDALNTMLQAGVDPNQHCSVIVGTFVESKGLCVVTAVHEDNTCDIVNCNSGVVQSRLNFIDGD